MKRRAPMRRTARRPKPKHLTAKTGWKPGGKRSAEWHRARQWVIDRAHNRCEVRCCDDCTGRAEHVHHILMRSQGGTHDHGNLLAVCHACHAHIHANPADSYHAGWLRRRPAS